MRIFDADFFLRHDVRSEAARHSLPCFSNSPSTYFVTRLANGKTS
ncbi:hypothetical protein C7S14_8087 [Burkholderia cepacia]|nr:hypothetical protein C7S14_8087 [Burkholderia cepacia]